MRLSSSFVVGLFSPAALLLTVLAPNAALAQQATDELAQTTDEVAQATDEVAQVKKEIISIAQTNQTRQDNVLQVYAQLDPLVKRLLALAPSKPEAVIAKQVAGGWRNLWSDMLFPPTVDLTQNYQVVSAKGFYYNVSRQTVFGGLESTGLLRGQYTDGGDHLNIEFTRNALAQGWLAPGTKLADYINKVESGSVPSFQIPGPDGVKGELKDAYVDNNLRIITGGDSLGESSLLYIMVRADSVVAPGK